MSHAPDRAAFSIRAAHEQDAGILANLIRRSFAAVAIRFDITRRTCPTHPSFCTDRWIEKDMAAGDTYFILMRDDIPSGCVGVKQGREPGTCYLTRLAVTPDMQHRGGGSVLIRKVLDEAREKGAKTVQVGIIANDERLEAWYRRRGFVVASHARFMHLPFRVTFLTRNLDLSSADNAPDA